MADKNTDFLRFNAYSIKDLITRKLSENSKFTDQIYEGSNLAILIDIVSYMYQCLILNLNNCASESMFADTQIYENINRLCKFIGYSPRGIKPAMANFEYIKENDDNDGKNIPAFCYIDTGKVDRNGKKICFSTYEDVEINKNINTDVALYNGIWKSYPTIFTASGLENETIILDSLDASKVAGEFVYVYVNSSEGVKRWKYDKDELFINMSRNNVTETNFASIYNSKETVYSIRVNENKNYELKFGNNVIGKKLSPGDKIYVLYLETNGEDGYIDMGDIQTAKLIDEREQFIPDDLQDLIIKREGEEASDIELFLTQNSSNPIPIETVDEIRENAPSYFKTGNRLITIQDYEYFIRTNYINDVVDVKCQNNFDYISSFFKWLWNIGKNGKLDHEKSGTYYIKQDRLQRSNYTYADPSDSNNVYIWLKFIPRIQNTSIYIQKMQQSINRITKNIKTLTQEIVACDVVDVNFAICAAPEDIALKEYLLKDGVMIEENNDSYVEITMDDNILYANSNVKYQIADIIWDSFKAENCKIGQSIDINSMTNKILSLNGILGIRTVFKKDDIEIRKNGLSFASWSAKYIERGDDLDVSNSSRTLEEFQFPVLAYTDKTQLLNKIVIIRKSLSNINTIKY